VDRRALLEVAVERSAWRAEYEEPRTVEEQLLAQIWSEVLGVAQVGVRENFFELGGHSLLATQVSSRIRKLWDVEVPLRKLFEQPTVAELAAELVRLRREQQGLVSPPLARRQSRGRVALSYAQQRLWFLEQLEPGSAVYNIAAAVRLRGQLQEQVLAAALREVVQRHEALRTRFVVEEGQPRQEISAGVELELRRIEVGGETEPERERQVAQLAAAAAGAGFDLAVGPLLRARLLVLGEQEYVLVLVLHHIVADGWSLAVLLRELTALYEAGCGGRAVQLPELELQYADYAEWQRQWLQGAVLEQQLEYWKEQLQGAPSLLKLPTDRSRPAVKSSNGSEHYFAVPATLLESLRSFGCSEGATLSMVLLATYSVLLHRYTGEEDICIGTPVANRRWSEVEKLIGLFINTLVIRAEFPRHATFRELLNRTREISLGAYAHQELPF
jgi:hypothetical protein